MDAEQFVNDLSHEDIVAAIGQAEKKTSGEVRVFVTRHEVTDAVQAAKSHFTDLKMDQTGDRNAILIFVAPRSRSFAVLGDAGIHERCGQDFWDRVSRDMREYFRQGEFSKGIIAGINRAADLLSVHFPQQADDVNELPDRVEHD